MKEPLGNLMKQAQRMQEDLKRAQDDIAAKEVIGESGAGLVKITMTGRYDVKAVSIAPELLQDDVTMLEDLVAAAVNDAVRKVERASAERMAGMAQGFNLPPGFKLPF